MKVGSRIIAQLTEGKSDRLDEMQVVEKSAIPQKNNVLAPEASLLHVQIQLQAEQTTQHFVCRSLLE